LFLSQSFAQQTPAWYFNRSHIASDEGASSLMVPPGGENVWSPDQSSLFISAYTGLNLNKNLGDFQASCDCKFEGEFALGNLGMILGVDATYQFTPNWAVMAKLYYDNKYSQETIERSIDTPIKQGSVVRINPVQYKEIANVSLSYFVLGAFMRWQPRLSRWYVFAGPAVGYGLTHSVQHKQEIVTAELQYRDNLDTKREITTDKFDQKIRIEGMVGFGYDYFLKPRLFLNPEIKIGYPLTKISDDDNWKVMSYQLTVGLKYEAF
jgi:hypothetical protein